MNKKIRCQWAGDDPIYIDYHDNEWGIPIHGDRLLFEFLILEGFQAGLSWITILKKRDNFRKAFDNFDFEKIALYDDSKILELLQNESIIRNRLKINAAVTNAKAFIDIRNHYGSFNNYIWAFVDNKPIKNRFKNMSQLPANTELSDVISKDLKSKGFKFVGSTIVYAYMQAVGMVNDHTVDCYCFSGE